jgi:glutathione S-transferase
VSPKSLTPAIQVAGMPLHDSSIINEFLEETYLDSNVALLPQDTYQRARARLAIDFINKTVVPSFFRLLQAQPDEPERQVSALEEFTAALATISSQRKGPFFFGDNISLVDIAIAPWAVRDFIGRDFRGFKREDVEGWNAWAEFLENRPSVRKTTSVSMFQAITETLEG